MSGPGVPAAPAALSAASDTENPDMDMETFLDMWKSVLSADAAAGLSPLTGPQTVLAVTDGGFSMMRPCDVSDPFLDNQLQRAVLRRHVLTELVPPTDGRFEAGAQVTRLDGGTVTLSKLGDSPMFNYGDVPAVARHIPGGDADVALYVVDRPFVAMDEITDAIGRHPQTNPFCCPSPELELEPEPEPETEAPQ